MVSLVDEEFQHEIYGVNSLAPDKVGTNGELDDDGRPRRTGTYLYIYM